MVAITIKSPYEICPAAPKSLPNNIKIEAPSKPSKTPASFLILFWVLKNIIPNINVKRGVSELRIPETELVT